MSPPAKRDDLLDTRRGALALAVVLGHVLAMLPGAGAAARAGVPVALGWEAAIDDARWTDGCHLDAEGEREKALALLPWAQKALGEALTPALPRRAGEGEGPSPLAGEGARSADGG